MGGSARGGIPRRSRLAVVQWDDREGASALRSKFVASRGDSEFAAGGSLRAQRHGRRWTEVAAEDPAAPIANGSESGFDALCERIPLRSKPLHVAWQLARYANGV